MSIPLASGSYSHKEHTLVVVDLHKFVHENTILGLVLALDGEAGCSTYM